MIRLHLLLAMAPLAAPTTACAAPLQAAPTPPAASSSFRAAVERYATDREDLRSFYSMQASPERLARLTAFEDDWRTRLAQADFEALDVGGRVDHLLLQAELDYEAALRAEVAELAAADAELLPFTPAVFELEGARWRLAPVDAEGAAEVLAEVAEQAEELRERLQATPEDDDGDDPAEDPAEEPVELEPSRALRLARRLDHLVGLLSTWHDHYADYDPGFSWWCEEPFGAARDALDALAKHLREEVAEQKGEDDDPLVGDPIGRAGLERDLAHEWLAYTPEELIAVGEAELARCDELLAEAAAEMGHGDDWRAALAEVKAAHVPPGEQDELVAAQAREMIAFLKERDLVTIPPLCEETWRVEMISEAGQRTLPFAAYNRQRMLVAYPTAGMELERKRMSLRGNNRHFTRAVTPHELIPGHHLQGFMARRHATHRLLFRTPFLVEGWALYWELLEWDEGWAKSPEDRVGMLFWRKHRAARIVVSLRFHLGEMRPEEMIDFLVERVGHEREGATSEVRRYVGDGYSPLYQCGYLIGALQLRALAREVVGGGVMERKAFHDAVLRENAIPIELLRATLLGVELERDAQPSWRPELRSDP